MIVERSPAGGSNTKIKAAGADELSRRDELVERLRWLINLRWVALAGVFMAVFAARHLNIVSSVFPLLVVAVTMGLLNAGFHLLHQHFRGRPLKTLSNEALLQITVDVAGLALLIFYAGGLSNPFIFYFSFHVVIASILLEKKQAYIVALMAALGVVMLGLAEEFQFATPVPLQGDLASAQPLTTLSRFEMVFALATTLVISVYMVTEIMESLRARTQDVRRLNADLADRVEKLAAAEKKLAAEHQRARAILECMDEGVVVVDLHGKVMLANTGAQKSSLMAAEEALRSGRRGVMTNASGHPAKEYCHGPLSGANLLQTELAGAIADPSVAAEIKARDNCPLGSPAACLQEALTHGGHLCPATMALLGAEPLQTEHGRLTLPKTPTLAQIEVQGRRFENTVSEVRTSAGEALGMVIVSRDTTERRLLERQVVHAEKLHALGNLAAGVAHELNTPLGTILGYAQMLLDEERQPVRELRAIEDQARRCRKIVQSLLDLARKSSGGREVCAADDLLLKVRDLLAHAMRLRGIELRVEPCVPPPPPLHVAVSEMEQVLVNLVTNAADALEINTDVPAPAGAVAVASGGDNAPLYASAPGGGPGGSASRLRAASRVIPGAYILMRTHVLPGGEVVISVEDNGTGVPPDIASDIFEPFFTTKAAGKGTGLGLSIARRIVEDHNGTLEMVPRPDGQPGARFEIRLDPRITSAP